MEVVGSYQDRGAALKAYGEMHRREPLREIFFFHTDRETIEIEESGVNILRVASPPS